MTFLAVMAWAALRVLAQVAVAVSAPATVGPRDPVLVKVEVSAPAGRTVRVFPPDFAPFRVLSTSRVASESGPSGGGARAWQLVEHRYVLSPTRPGAFSFAPFAAVVSAPGLPPGRATSRAWEIVVRAPPPAPPEPDIVARARVNAGRSIDFHALVVPETVYVGQQATYQVAVFVDEVARLRLRRNPEFLPPELRGMLAYDLPAGRALVRDRTLLGRRWDVHVFQRAVFPLDSGTVAVPPAQLTYALPLSSGFFSREESFTARSEGVRLVALMPPAAGRPSDWVGAVGQLRASARVAAQGARVGDPLVLTMRVEGAANVKLLPRPALSVPWATAVPAEERVQVDSAALRVRGAKEFDWILTPRASGEQTVPALRYAYFDPYERRYDVALTTPVPVLVGAGALAATAADSAARAALLPIRTAWRGALPEPLPRRPLYWALAAVAPVPAGALLLLAAPRRRRPAMSAEMRLRARARGGATEARAVRRELVAALADRLHVTPGELASHATIARLLRRRGTTRETALGVARLLEQLDAAAYGNALAGPDGEVGARAWALYRRVDVEACDRSTLQLRPTPARGVGSNLARVLAGAALLGGVAGAAWAARGDPAADAFATGVAAYGERRFADAQRAFEDAGSAAPAAADAWANAGTAGWLAGDTVAATAGWQRALRLEPRARDVRAGLALLPAAQGGRVAGVPPVPVDWSAAAALLCWVGACAAAALALRPAVRRRPLARTAWRAAAALVAAATVSAAGTAYLTDVRDGAELAVVRTSGPLRTDPSPAGEPRAPVQPSDVARVLARQAAWVRVRLDDDREGWIEASRLSSLAMPGHTGA